MTPRTRSAGFTLVEVMVALAIVAITLGAGLRAAAALANNANRLEQVLAAQWCAENTLTGLRLSRLQPSIGDADLSCEQYGYTFTGKLVTRPMPANALLRLVQASFSNEQGQHLVTLSTLLVRR